MKSLPNVLRVVLVDPPTAFDGIDAIEPMLKSKRGFESGVRDAEGNVRFETPYVCTDRFEGTAFKREQDGRFYVQVDWYGTKNGARKRLGKIKVYLDAAANLVWDTEIVVAGRGPDGSPAHGVATVLRTSNIDDFVDLEPWSPDSSPV